MINETKRFQSQERQETDLREKCTEGENINSEREGGIIKEM